MKIFVSWSGRAEQTVAEALAAALPNLCAADVEVFVSSKSIAKGAIGTAVIEASLDSSDFGLVLVSQANQSAPWLMYEGGWLASTLQRPVATVCLDLRPSDIATPLSPRQGTVFSEEDMRVLLRQIVASANPSMTDQTFDVLFKSAWPSIETSWVPGGSTSPEPHRSDSDMLSELVERVRRIEERELSKASVRLRPADLSPKGRPVNDVGFESLVKAITARRSRGQVSVISASLRDRDARVVLLAPRETGSATLRGIEEALTAVLPSDARLIIDVITANASGDLEVIDESLDADDTQVS